MKAEELLMIGDWFRFRYTIDGREKVKTFRISQIENELGKYYVWGNGFGRMCYPDRLEPIPITPEILEKNGFSKLEHGWILKRIGMEICVEFIAEKWSLVIHNELALKDEHGRADLVTFCHDWFKGFYVHELQHALRLVGIKKEIVL